MNTRPSILFTLILILSCVKAYCQERTEIFVSPSDTGTHYRIPAVAALPDGSLIGVADYRFSRNDVGIVKDGRIDLRVRSSRDNGNTWGEISTLVEGQGKDSPDFMNVAFGDPCIVADRKSGRILVMCAAGNISFLDGTRECHLRIPRFYSEDKGCTWSAAEDISESLYTMFDNAAYGPAKSMFITSGRIVQSRYVKAGKYYRLYCAILQIGADDVRRNLVLYSDDFGLTWDILGGVETPAITSNADEAKVEELPGGDIVISSRTYPEGRLFNIFRFRNLRRATGEWCRMVLSSTHNNGIMTKKNSCNGELLIVPVVRKSDGRKMELLLQSAPAGPKRANVGIYFRGLETDRTYSPEDIAAGWEGFHKVTHIGSAYSVMALQTDGRIGFMFEEKTYYPTSGAGYTIIYEALDVEDITNGRYSLRKK